MMTYIFWAVMAVLVIFLVLQVYDLIVMGSRSPLDDFLSDNEERKGLSQKVGEALLGRFSFLGIWDTYLSWAHLGGKMVDWTMAQVVSLALLLAGVGFGLSFFFPVPALKFLPLVAVLPFLQVRSAGMNIKKATERTVPETSALIAAELSAGASVEDAVARAAELPGPLSKVLDQAVDQAANAGRPLTSRGNQSGMLSEVLGELDLPALRGFALQLDTVARSGVDSAERMQEISTTLAAEYRQRVRDNIKVLDKSLTLAVSIFYFAPFFVILMVGTFGAALSSF